MQPQTHRLDLSARVLAFAVFLLGIALLCLVFGQAWALFHAPVAHLPLPIAPGAAPPPPIALGAALAEFARQLLLLIVMTVAGSVVAGKGIQLYFSACTPQSASPSSHAAPPRS